MTRTDAKQIAREYGLTLADDRGGKMVLIEARYITLNAPRCARISTAEWRGTCHQIVDRG